MQDRNGGRGGDVLANAMKGAIAGAVGVWVMDRLVWWMWDREDSSAILQEAAARPEGLDPAHVMANRAAEAVGTRLTPRQPHPAGIAVHYGLGVLPGAAYGALRSRMGGAGLAGGLAYGLTLFLMQDEGMNPILGTSGKPGDYPWQAHARGLAGHLALGAATHATLDLLDRVA